MKIQHRLAAWIEILLKFGRCQPDQKYKRTKILWNLKIFVDK